MRVLFVRGLMALSLVASIFLITSCASQLLKKRSSEEIQNNQEFDDVVKVKILTPPPGDPKSSVSEPTLPPLSEVPPASEKDVKKKSKKTKPKLSKIPPQNPTPKESKKDEAATVEVQRETPPEAQARRRPELEDDEGFMGRRPLVDPFRAGEKVVLALTYFGVEAGEMVIETKSYAEINGRRGYNFVISLKSSTSFSLFYSVDDWAEAYVDYETLLPIIFSMHVKESKQIKEVRSYLDWAQHEATLWEKKITDEHGIQERKINWEVQPYSQNPFSAAFYLRTFTLRPGKEIAFRVSDEGKDIVFKGKVLREEVLETELGPMKTLVLEPTIEIQGIFSQVGQILFWLTNDDRKMIVRIESKIKIGTIIGRLRSLVR